MTDRGSKKKKKRKREENTRGKSQRVAGDVVEAANHLLAVLGTWLGAVPWPNSDSFFEIAKRHGCRVCDAGTGRSIACISAS